MALRCPLLPFLVALELLSAAQALRVLAEYGNATEDWPHDNFGNTTGEAGGGLNLFAEGRLTHLPYLSAFTSTWRRRYALERHLQEPMPASVQLVMGVFTVAGEAAYRDVIRSTWLQQRGICLWSTEQQEGCSVYVALVMGQAPEDMPWEIKKAYLEQRRRWTGASKSMVWMEAALRTFPWATHYGKMDMDTYPFFHKLLARMDTNRSCVAQTSAYEWIGRPCDFDIDRMGAFTQACPYQPCQGWFDTPTLSEVNVQAPFRFMAGEFYILSKALVAGISWWPQRGNEDIVMSNFVAEFSRSSKKCVVLRKLDAHAHLGTTRRARAVLEAGVVNEAYANDF